MPTCKSCRDYIVKDKDSGICKLHAISGHGFRMADSSCEAYHDKECKHCRKYASYWSVSDWGRMEPHPKTI